MIPTEAKALADHMERLCDALAPFCGPGGGANMQAYHDLDDETVVWQNGGMAVTAGDVRNAREVLAKVKGKPVSMMHFRRRPSYLELDLQAGEAIPAVVEALRWYAAPHRPEDYLNDNGDRAIAALAALDGAKP